MTVGVCKLCKREASNVTEHHLIPRSTHRVKRFKRMHSTAAMHVTATMCQPCHRAMHQFFTEKELAESFFTINLLLSDERIIRHVEFVKKQRGSYRMKRSAKGRAR